MDSPTYRLETADPTVRIELEEGDVIAFVWQRTCSNQMDR